MRFADPDFNTPVNYFVQFEATADERASLLRYLEYLSVEQVYDRVMDDSRFAPSSVWRRWASGTFVGVSGDRLMIKSGHRFMDAYEPLDYLSTRSGPPPILRLLKKCIAKIRQTTGYGALEDHINTFDTLYKSFHRPPQHDFLLDRHGFAYLRMLEVFNLTELPQAPEKVVEIGGGACVNAALMIGAYGCKYVVIDLPETITVGFAFLKAVFPELRVALPNVVHDYIEAGREFESLFESYDVVFLLPHQSDAIAGDTMDLAFNVSSFQEMEINVVNEYLSLLRRILKKNGRVVLENLKVSREIKGNSFEKYDLTDFSVEKKCAPTYANHVIKKLVGLEHFFYQGRKA